MVIYIAMVAHDFSGTCRTFCNANFLESAMVSTYS